MLHLQCPPWSLEAHHEVLTCMVGFMAAFSPFFFPSVFCGHPPPPVSDRLPVTSLITMTPASHHPINLHSIKDCLKLPVVTLLQLTCDIWKLVSDQTKPDLSVLQESRLPFTCYALSCLSSYFLTPALHHQPHIRIHPVIQLLKVVLKLSCWCVFAVCRLVCFDWKNRA